jgi:hypothetical protein
MDRVADLNNAITYGIIAAMTFVLKVLSILIAMLVASEWHFETATKTVVRLLAVSK